MSKVCIKLQVKDKKARLDHLHANYKERKCKVCKTVRSYQNPLDTCFECKDKFCFDHLYGLAVNKTMKLNDEVRTVCEKCFVKYKYHSLGAAEGKPLLAV